MQAFAALLIIAYSFFVGFVTAFKDTLLPPPMSGMNDGSNTSGQPTFSGTDFSGSAYNGASIENVNVNVTGYSDDHLTNKTQPVVL